MNKYKDDITNKSKDVDNEVTDEIMIKDIKFTPLTDEQLLKTIEKESIIRGHKSRRNTIIVIIEILLFLMFTIIDPNLNKLRIPAAIVIIALTIEYFVWMIGKYKKIIKHFDINHFFKSSTKKEIKYTEVLLDDIVKINSNGYHAMVSTLDGKKVMEKIDIPCIEKIDTNFDRTDEDNKQKMYLLISGYTFFAVETLDNDWWQRNISKMR